MTGSTRPRRPTTPRRPGRRGSAWPPPAATHETPYGTAAVSWTLTGGTAFELELTVPPNAVAEVALPDGSAPIEKGSGWHRFACRIDAPVPVEKPASPWSPE